MLHSKISLTDLLALGPAVLVALAPLASAHCVITSVRGDRSQVTDGKTCKALGNRPEVPRNHGSQFAAHWDVSVFRTTATPWIKPPCTNDACCHANNCWDEGYYKPVQAYYNPSGCGVTLANLIAFWDGKKKYGDKVQHYFDNPDPLDYSSEPKELNWERTVKYYQQPVPPGAWVDPNWEIWQIAQNDLLTQATAGGWLVMNLHVVNDDGVGPFKCKLDQTATGWGGGRNEWDGWLTVNQTNVQQEDPRPEVQAERGRSTIVVPGPRDYTMYVDLPKNLECTGQTLNGKIQNLCLVRCENLAPTGPFGGCVVFQQYKPPKPQKTYPPKPAPKPKTRISLKPQPSGYKDPTEPNVADDYAEGYTY